MGTQGVMDGGKQYQEPSSDRVDTVVMLKSQDSGSTFLDEHVFPQLEQVARWQKELTHDFLAGEDIAGYFEHKAGEEGKIVGASIQYQDFQEAGKDLDKSAGFCKGVAPHFTKEKHGRTLFIHLIRDPVAKWVSILRRDVLADKGCNKWKMHMTEEKGGCASMKSKISPTVLSENIEREDVIHKALAASVQCSMSNNPELFVAKEVYDYDEVLECQGVPQHINKYLGNDVDGCNHESSYYAEHPRKKIEDIVENIDELRAFFKGTKWEDSFVKNGRMFYLQ